MLAVSAAVALLFVLAPLIFLRKETFGATSAGTRIAVNGYFLALGLAYLMVEVPLIQKLILFLGHPVYALTVVLFSLLLFSGIGSGIAGKIPEDRLHLAGIFSVLAAVIIALATWLLPAIVESLIGLPIAARIALSVLFVAPIGLLMGIPFPSGVRAASAIHPVMVSWAWAVNGAASMVAPVLAMMIAILWGFAASQYLGALLYLIAALLFLLCFPKRSTEAAG